MCELLAPFSIDAQSDNPHQEQEFAKSSISSGPSAVYAIEARAL